MFPFFSTDPFISWPTNKAQAAIGNCLLFKIIYMLFIRFTGNIFWKLLLDEVETMQLQSQSKGRKLAGESHIKRTEALVGNFEKNP